MPPTVRLARPADAAGCLEIYRPLVASTAISFETEPPGETAFAARVSGALESLPWLVYESEHGVVAGYAHASPHRARDAYRWSAEVSVYVRDSHRRRGVARSLYTSLFRCLRHQGYVNAYAGIALPNEASVAFHEAMGFEWVGVYRQVGFKLGRWHDVGWWALRLVETDAPVPPRPLRDCREEVVALLQRRLRDSTG